VSISGIGEVAEKLRRSTAVVRSGSHGGGSGVVWSSDGVVVTNAHVVRGSHATVELWDGREFEAVVSSRDVRRDLAALRVPAKDLPAAPVADSSRVRPGEIAIAIGNPLGFVGALTAGTIHAVGPIDALGEATWVQATLRLAPGNSGGPLADASGNIVGINTMVAGGLALAIPSNTVLDFLTSGAADAWLGVTVAAVRIPSGNGGGGGRRRDRDKDRERRFGLVLLEVDPAGPAATASMMAGDILLGTEENRFRSAGDLFRVLQGSAPRLLRLEFLRGDYANVRRVTAVLGGPARNSIAA
jgi:serine protease Do